MATMTLLMPVFNEGKSIVRTVREFYKTISKDVSCEIVLCEDGSTDNTKEVLLKLQKELPIKLYLGKERKGYQKAAHDALTVAETPLVFMVDSDGQYLPDDFSNGLKYISEYDIVIGRRIRSKESIHRRMLRSGHNMILRAVFHIPIHDIDCGYKIMKKKVIDKVLQDNISCFPYGFNAEFVIRAYYHGFKIKEFEIRHAEREFGDTSVFPFRELPKVIFAQLRGIKKLKSELRKQQNS